MTIQKSIYEIEIKDDAFKRFKAAFDDYNKALKNSPLEWKKTSSEAQQAGKSLVNIGSEIKKIEDSTKSTALNMEKFHYATVATGHAFTSLTRTSASMARNVVEATGSLLKMVGITGAVTGLMGAGGLWGISHLASSGSDLRYRSMGVGSSAGGYQAANAQLQSILGVGGGGNALSAINAGLSNASMGWTFGGINTSGKSAEQVIGPLLQAAQKLAKSTPQGQLANMSEAYGYSNYFDLETMTRLRSMSTEEVSQTLGTFGNSSKNLSINDPTLEKWQKLNNQLDESAAKLKTIFITGLVDLSKPLGDLSKELNGVVNEIFTSGKFKSALDSVVDGLKSLNQWIGKGGLEDSFDYVEGVIYGFARSANKMLGVFGNEKTLKMSEYRDIESNFSPDMAKAIENRLENPSSLFTMGDVSDTAIWNEVKKNPALAAKFKQYGFNVPTEDPSIYASIDRSVNGFLNNVGGIMKSGSLTKFLGYSSKEDGVRDLHRLLRSKTYAGRNTIASIINEYEGGEVGNPHHNDIDAYIRDVAKNSGIDANQMINKNSSYDMSRLISAITRHEGISPMTSDHVKVIIENNTGGNATVNAAQVAH